MVFGISKDSPAANAAYAREINVHFPLLSDQTGEALKQYGVPLRLKKVGSTSYELAQRATFLIDKQGVIRRVELAEEAVDPAKMVTACSQLEHSKQRQ